MRLIYDKPEQPSEDLKPSKGYIPKWLEWAREIQQLCQTGLAFSESEYDTTRYKQLTKIATKITAAHSQIS